MLELCDHRVVTALPEVLAQQLVSASPQRKFQFNREQWERWLGPFDGISAMLERLPEDGVDRADVAAVVERELPTNPVGAFVTSMIWGHGSSNYGAFRTARVLTAERSGRASHLSDAVADKLATSVAVVRTSQAVEGFRYLNNKVGGVRWLGPAFFTKWLYFASARGSLETPDAAPILDALIVRWLRREAGGTSGRAGPATTNAMSLCSWTGGKKYR